MKIKPTEPSHRVAILHNGTKFGAIALTIGAASTVLGSYIHTDQSLRHSVQQSPAIGLQQFNASLDSSIKVGWRIGFIGRPNNAYLS